MELTRIKNDINGNPRYVVHFLELIRDDEYQDRKHELSAQRHPNTDVLNSLYATALKKAKKIGGRKFHNKQFGGGIVFQSYNTPYLIKSINEIKEL